MNHNVDLALPEDPVAEPGQATPSIRGRVTAIRMISHVRTARDNHYPLDRRLAAAMMNSLRTPDDTAYVKARVEEKFPGTIHWNGDEPSFVPSGTN